MLRDPTFGLVERDISELIDDLVRAARAHELEAARAREFIADGEPVPEPVRFALDAAVNSGMALGLLVAARRIADLLC